MMDAKKFIRELVRMCKSHGETCGDCPILQAVRGCPLIVPGNADADVLVDVIEKWSKEHPVVTNGQKVLEMIPDDVRSTTYHSALEHGHPNQIVSEDYVKIRIKRSWWDAEYKAKKGGM